MDDFDQFWDAYPRKVGKGGARRKFAIALTKTTLQTMLEALAWQCTQPQWSKDGGQYVPHASTWLSQERWSDDRPQIVTSPRVARAFEALDDDIRIARRRDELLRSGKSRAEVSAILEAESALPSRTQEIA